MQNSTGGSTKENSRSKISEQLVAKNEILTHNSCAVKWVVHRSGEPHKERQQLCPPTRKSNGRCVSAQAASAGHRMRSTFACELPENSPVIVRSTEFNLFPNIEGRRTQRDATRRECRKRHEDMMIPDYCRRKRSGKKGLMNGRIRPKIPIFL